ncbi:metal ABC transporter permease [Mesonia sp. HuA40]|uniref:metal ABC transporter permease n=1 Tax=Mesonia sp. HuA40 TaxID=2602761 RepID=UPI0011CC9E7D|nr:metal ABC transporter permease [Mesonia sp. HuA40]TXK72716.1 metal ABC transporter permease [Mesonia sp. HuA40]
MSNAQIEIQLIAALAAMACAIPGVFLVLRKMAMISDAISHSILPGLVVGFFITQDLNSPWLILLAAVTGVLTVVLVEFIQKTRLVKEDTAIGLVFPALFSVGVILIAQNANDVHLDIDAVLLGELAFAPFDRLLVGDIDLGPKSLWVIGCILFMSLSLLILFFKELKMSTFDKGLATSLGFSPLLIHYGLMSVSSVTIVGAFDAVGAVLVVALIIAPAATAYLLTNSLKKMLILSLLFGVFSALVGYWLAHWLDASIAGSMTSVLGILFLLVFMFAPRQGVISAIFKEKQQRKEVSLLIFLLHLQNHEDPLERHINHLQEHINWHRIQAKTVVDLAKKNNLIEIENQVINLSDKGLQFTEEALKYITTNKPTAIEDLKNKFFLFRG